MASALSKVLDYKYMATVYSNLNHFQLKCGEEFVALLDIKPGEKVLDMGCGTGEVTSYIASQVAEEGQVVGVDPDEERIKIAVEKHLNGRSSNLSFTAGDSSSDFPHSNEEYYDLHFSNLMFHWLTPEEKGIFLKTAMKCVKIGGRVAIHVENETPEIFRAAEQLFPGDANDEYISPVKLVDKETAESMVKDHSFEILSSEYEERDHTFASVDEYLAWICACGYLDESKIVPAKRKAFAEKYANKDGTVRLEITFYHIIAKKI